MIGEPPPPRSRLEDNRLLKVWSNSLPAEERGLQVQLRKSPHMRVSILEDGNIDSSHIVPFKCAPLSNAIVVWRKSKNYEIEGWVVWVDDPKIYEWSLPCHHLHKKNTISFWYLLGICIFVSFRDLIFNKFWLKIVKQLKSKSFTYLSIAVHVLRLTLP